MNPNNINNQNENQERNQTFSNVHPPISREPAISNPNIMSRDYVSNLEIEKMNQRIKRLHKRKKYRDNVSNIKELENIYDTQEPLNKMFDKSEQIMMDNANSSQEGFDVKDAASIYNYGVNAVFDGINHFPNRVDNNIRGTARAFVKTFTKMDHNFDFSEKAKKKPKKRKHKDGFTLNGDAERLNEKPDNINTDASYNITGTGIANSALSSSAKYFGLDKPAEKPPNQLEHDTNILTDLIYYIISLPLAIWVMYNWFYMMAYYDKEGIRPTNDNVRMKIEIPQSLSNEVKDNLNIFLAYSIFPLHLLDKFMLSDSKFPLLLKIFPYKTFIKFMILFFSLVLVFKMNFFQQFNLSFKGAPSIVTVYSSILIVVLLCQVLIKSSSDIVDKYKQMGAWATLAMVILNAFGRLIIAILSIFVSNMLIVLYVWLYSLFGIVFYGEGSVEDKISNIDSFIEKEIDALKDKDLDCFEPDLIKRILRFVIGFLYSNMYMFVLFGMLLHGIFMAKSMFSITCQIIVSIILAMLLLLVISFMYANGMKYAPSSKAATKNPAAKKGGETPLQEHTQYSEVVQTDEHLRSPDNTDSQSMETVTDEPTFAPSV